MEHHFNIELATKFGIGEAIFLHNLYYWIQKNAANKKQYFDGSYWTYNTVQAYAEIFPYMSYDKVKRLIAGLKTEGIIKTGNYGKDKMNHTTWYAFTEKGLEVMKNTGYKIAVFIEDVENRAKTSYRIGQNAPIEYGKMPQSIYTNINNTNINNTDKSCSNEQPKNDYSEDFLSFWLLYHNGSKQQAFKEWKKLTVAERIKAKEQVHEYLDYCKRSGRTLKDTSSYLHQKGFNEEWLVTPECYKPVEGEEEKISNYKQYMCSNHRELIYHRNPLTYEQATTVFQKYGTEQVEWAMRKLKERDIHQYYSIAQGLEAVLSDDDLRNDMEE